MSEVAPLLRGELAEVGGGAARCEENVKILANLGERHGHEVHYCLSV